MHGYALFHQPVEQPTLVRGLVPVEPKRKFVQVSLKVIGLERPLMRTHQPALNERRNAVYARQNLVGFFARTLDRCCDISDSIA